MTRRATVACALAAWLVLGGELARAGSPECAYEGQALASITDELSPKELEREVRRVLGPAFAGIVRRIPWADIYRGDASRGQRSYFLQGFGRRVTLPELTFRIAAPPPIAMQVELRLDTVAPSCVPIELERDAADGSVTLDVPVIVVVTMAVGGLSARWELPANDARVRWERRDGTLRASLDAGDLSLGLAGPGIASDVPAMLESLRDSPALARGKELLVRSLARPGRHRRQASALVGELGVDGLPGELWGELRRLHDARRLRTDEVHRLGWLARRPADASNDEATIFTFDGSGTRPRIFVAGQEHTRWTRVGGTHELPVPVTGLAAVRVEYGERSAQTFVTAFARGVRIRFREVWGPMLEGAPPGPRCGLVRDPTSALCGHQDSVAPIGRVFALRAVCGGSPAAYGSAIDFGDFLVPSLPGLYVRDRRDGLQHRPLTRAERERCEQEQPGNEQAR